MRSHASLIRAAAPESKGPFPQAVRGGAGRTATDAKLPGQVLRELSGQSVLLFNHFPLPYTVSQTHSSWEQNNYENIDAFNAVVGKYTNILMFTGHTHDDLNLNDWWGTYRVADPKNPAGFTVVNTGAVLNAYVPDGDVDSTRIDGDQSTGLRVYLHADRIRVEAYDFVARKSIKYQDFATDGRTGRN